MHVRKLLSAFCIDCSNMLILSLLVTFVHCMPSPRVRDRADVFNLTIIHVNDIHAHFEEVSVNTTRCREEDEDCYGGVARMVTKKNAIMQEDPDALFLNAGDFYQGF